MERDIELLIRRKVIAAENQPAPWHKEQVWMKVSEGLEHASTKKTPYYYYAAACFVLLMACSVYLLNKSEHQKNEARINTLLSRIEKTKSDLAARISVPQEGLVPTCEDEWTEPTGSRKIITIQKPPVPEITTVMAEKILIATVATDSSGTTTASVADIQPQKKERIKPVIGVFDTTVHHEEVAQHKRKKFPWFKPREEDHGPFQHQPQTIIARIH
jgi:hypothetical protein